MFVSLISTEPFTFLQKPPNAVYLEPIFQRNQAPFMESYGLNGTLNAKSIGWLNEYLATCEVPWTDVRRPHLSGSQRIELLNAKLDIWIGGFVSASVSASVRLFIFLRCHPITCDESQTGPSITTRLSFADSKAIGQVPNTLQIARFCLYINYIYTPSTSQHFIISSMPYKIIIIQVVRNLLS